MVNTIIDFTDMIGVYISYLTTSRTECLSEREKTIYQNLLKGFEENWRELGLSEDIENISAKYVGRSAHLNKAFLSFEIETIGRIFDFSPEEYSAVKGVGKSSLIELGVLERRLGLVRNPEPSWIKGKGFRPMTWQEWKENYKQLRAA